MLYSARECTERACREIGGTRMRVLEGVGTLVQLGGLMAASANRFVVSLLGTCATPWLNMI